MIYKKNISISFEDYIRKVFSKYFNENKNILFSYFYGKSFILTSVLNYNKKIENYINIDFKKIDVLGFGIIDYLPFSEIEDNIKSYIGKYGNIIAANDVEVINIDNIEDKFIFNIEKSFDILYKTSLNVFLNISKLLENIYIVKGKTITSGSNPRMLGCIFLNEKLDFLEILELIIHESCHLLLFSLELNKGFFFSEKDKKFDTYSPIKKNKRSIYLAFHAIYVSVNLFVVFNLIVKANLLTEEENNHLLKRIGIFKKHSNEGLKELEKNKHRLLKNSLEIFEEMKKAYNDFK